MAVTLLGLAVGGGDQQHRPIGAAALLGRGQRRGDEGPHRGGEVTSSSRLAASRARRRWLRAMVGSVQKRSTSPERVTGTTYRRSTDVTTDVPQNGCGPHELNALWVRSRPTWTSDSTASAARLISMATASRVLDGKLLSRKSAGSCRPGGRPTPTRTRKKSPVPRDLPDRT